MDFATDKQVAAFRYGLITPIVSRQTSMIFGELKRQLNKIAALNYTNPSSYRTTLVCACLNVLSLALQLT